MIVGPVTTLRSRALGLTSAWVAGTAVLIALGGDRTYLFRVANGVDPRPLAFAELVTVIGACCVPAIAAPRLWSWERTRPRAHVRILASGFAPSAIVVLAAMPWALQRLGVISLPIATETLFSNSALYGGASIVLGVWIGRRNGTILAVVGYVGGVVVQALRVALPIPFENVDRSVVELVVGTLALAVGSGCLATTLGRSGRSLDP